MKAYFYVASFSCSNPLMNSWYGVYLHIIIQFLVYFNINIQFLVYLNINIQICFCSLTFYAPPPTPMSQNPVSILNQISIKTSRHQQGKLTFTACLNIPTSSSTRLGDCRTACLSNKARECQNMSIHARIRDAAHQIPPPQLPHSPPRRNLKSTSNICSRLSLSWDQHAAVWQSLHSPEDKGQVPSVARASPAIDQCQEHIYL